MRAAIRLNSAILQLIKSYFKFNNNRAGRIKARESARERGECAARQSGSFYNSQAIVEVEEESKSVQETSSRLVLIVSDYCVKLRGGKKERGHSEMCEPNDRCILLIHLNLNCEK